MCAGPAAGAGGAGGARGRRAARRSRRRARGGAGDAPHAQGDDVCRFVNPGTVVLCRESDPRDANYRPLAENRERLEGMRLEDGSKIAVVDLPMPAPLYFAGQRLPASYANFYIANAAVLVPTFNDPKDRVALGILAELITDRPVGGGHAGVLVWGLGTIHCLTQQEPDWPRAQARGQRERVLWPLLLRSSAFPRSARSSSARRTSTAPSASIVTRSACHSSFRSRAWPSSSAARRWSCSASPRPANSTTRRRSSTTSSPTSPSPTRRCAAGAWGSSPSPIWCTARPITSSGSRTSATPKETCSP